MPFTLSALHCFSLQDLHRKNIALQEELNDAMAAQTRAEKVVEELHRRYARQVLQEADQHVRQQREEAERQKEEQRRKEIMRQWEEEDRVRDASRPEAWVTGAQSSSGGRSRYCMGREDVSGRAEPDNKNAREQSPLRPWDDQKPKRPWRWEAEPDEDRHYKRGRR